MSRSRRRFIFPVGILLLACSSLSIVAAQGRSHQPPIRQIELDHTDFDSIAFDSQELAATAVTPFCKSFTFLCHIRCLQRGDLQNPGNDPSAPSSAQKIEINRCNHVPNTHKMQVLCLCNNGVDLTAEIDYALEGVVDIAAAGGDGTGAGEAGKIREIVYAATLTLTESVYKTITLTSTTTMPAPPAVTTTVTVTATGFAAAQSTMLTVAAALDSPKTPASEPILEVVKESAGKDSLPISKSDQTVISIETVETKNKKIPENKEAQDSEETQDNEDTQENEDTQDDDIVREVAVSTPLNEGPEGSFNEADWASDPDAYQDPYLREEFIVPIDDEQQAYEDESEVEAEEEIGPLGDKHGGDDVDLEEGIDQSTHLQKSKHRSKDDDDEDEGEDEEEEDDDRHKRKHKVDHEAMFPPFDIDSEPLPKDAPHKHSHDKDEKDQKKKDHNRDRDEDEDGSEPEDEDEDEEEDDVDEDDDD